MAKDKDGVDFVTDDNSGGYFVFCCQNCGLIGNSKDMAVSGGYDDSSCFCPSCYEPDPEEHDNVGEVWNFQQSKINKLNNELDKLMAAMEKIYDSGDLRVHSVNIAKETLGLT